MNTNAKPEEKAAETTASKEQLVKLLYELAVYMTGDGWPSVKALEIIQKIKAELTPTQLATAIALAASDEIIAANRLKEAQAAHFKEAQAAHFICSRVVEFLNSP